MVDIHKIVWERRDRNKAHIDRSEYEKLTVDEVISLLKEKPVHVFGHYPGIDQPGYDHGVHTLSKAWDSGTGSVGISIGHHTWPAIERWRVTEHALFGY